MSTRHAATLALMAVIAFALGTQPGLSAEAKVVPTGVPTSPDTGFVTVPLTQQANALIDLPFTTNCVKVNGIPFAIPNAAGANHVFLKDVGWPNWDKDPSSFYSAYDRLPTAPDPRRVVCHVPVADYASLFLLAATDDDPRYTNVVSFRIGTTDYAGRVDRRDVSATIPRMGDERAREPFIPTAQGKVFFIKIPLGMAMAQDFQERWALDVDITKALRPAIRRPDPCRYQIRPLGLPSGVRIFAATFHMAPVQMEVTATQPGHVFNQPEVPTFSVSLRKSTAIHVPIYTIAALTTDTYGNTYEHTVTNVDLGRLGRTTVSVAVPVKKRGYHELELQLKLRQHVVLTRKTTFALLPPDTRKHRDRSPFGTWDFCGGHYTPNDADLVGPLYVKAGLRYGMFSFSDEERARYGVLRGNDPTMNPKTLSNLVARAEAEPNMPPPERLMIFHETAISGAHITRVPDLFTGRPPYRLDEKEQAKLDTLWAAAEHTARGIRENFPEAEIYFGNGAPQLLEAFLRRQFPKELLGSRGNEAGTFMRMPEAQPLDFVANNPGLWMDRMLLDHYGYTNTPLRQCYEMCYPSTNPGNLSLPTQADYFVRHMMHSLAWRIPIIRACIIADVGNSYYFSNWGAAGLCFARPHVRPKPSYVACATLTLMLDGAEFTRAVPTGSPVVYANEFLRQDGRTVTCLWTVRGTRELDIGTVGSAPAVLTDLMGNDETLPLDQGVLRVAVSSSPSFLVTAKPIGAITPGAAQMAPRPEGKSFAVSDLARLEDWTVETKASTELEIYNFANPRRKGTFTYAAVGSFEGETNALRVTPTLPAEGSEYLQMYSVLRHNQGVEIPGEPTQIGLMVNGNGGWGHVYFEMEDASGQRWVSLGAEQAGEPTRWMQDWLGKEAYDKLESAGLSDWNTDDPWGRSAINFEGWRYLTFPLPGQYPGEGYHWPYSSQWRYSGDGIVKYPLTFKTLIVTLPENVLHLTEYSAVPRKAIYLKDLMVTYAPLEKAFAAE